MADLCMDVDAALAEVPVNILPLIDDTDFKSREVSIAYNASGMDLVWNFVTTAGAFTQTAVTPTTAGDYDWTHQGDGMYTIEIPASGGASINNDTEGYGWFTGFIKGVLPFRGPVICFRAAGLNDALVDGAYSTTRGLAGTALPNAAADAAGGLPVSDAGGLNLDAILADTNELQTDWVNGGRLDLILDARASQASLDTVDGIVDAILVDTSTDIPATLSAIAAYVDTEVAAIKAKTDNLPASPAATGDIPSASTIAAAVWAHVVEGSSTAVEYLRIMLSSAAAKLSGAATTTVSIRDAGDTKDRIVATVDADGNRTAVTLDGS